MKPRMVFVAPRVPYPLDNGWNQRMFHILKALATVGDVDLVCYAAKEPAVDLEPLRRLCDQVHILEEPASRWPHPPENYRDVLERFVIARRPYFVAEFPGHPLAERVADLARDASLIWVDGLYVAEWIEVGRSRMIVDLDDIESVKQRRRLALQRLGPWQLALHVDNLKTRRLERTAPERYARIALCSAGDRRFFPARLAERLLVVPNGVPARLLDCPSATPEDASIVFVANMRYDLNVDAAFWFAREVFPRIAGAIPGVRLFLVGHDDRGRVRSLHDGASIVVTGRVDDVAPYVAQAAVSVVPLRAGGGTRIKILESLALGTPVVSTTIGAEGIVVTPGRHIEIADTPEQFAAAVVRLLRDGPGRRAMAAAGRALIAEQYTWEDIARRLAERVEQWIAEQEFSSPSRIRTAPSEGRL